MATQFHITRLRPGMRIEKPDRSWFETPLLRQRMAVTSMEQVEQLKACGVETLDVSGKTDRDTTPREEAEPEPAASSATPSVAGTSPDTPTNSFEEELPAAKNVIEQAMLDVRMGRAINMDAVNQVLSEMANSDVLTEWKNVYSSKCYIRDRLVNASGFRRTLLALSLGRNLKIDESLLRQLGIGILLHDIGKTKVSLEILNKPGKYESYEFEIMKQHVMRGAEVLSGTTGLTDNYLRPALEHHERVDGTGYPYHRRKSEISQ